MNINAAIIDQRLQSIRDEIRDRAEHELNINQEDKLKFLAFVFLCVKTVLDLPDDEAFDCITEGGGDFGVDAIHYSEEMDGEFVVTLFQGKYKNNLEGDANFPEGGIDDLNKAIGYIFDPGAKLERVNDRLKSKMEEIRSLIRDGYIPRIRVLACNNGLPWNTAGQDAIDRTGFGDQVNWEHVNHDRLVMILQAPKFVTDTLQLTGKAIVEDFNFVRVLVARISVTEIAAMFERHGEKLLERNIRRYLGIAGNRVNEAISLTLQGDERSNFYFYNNGITMICDKFSYNALQSGDYKVKVENLQIINGGQTCMTIHKTLNNKNLFNKGQEDAYVLIRLYQLPSDNRDLVQQITFATNSQNPVDMRDLRANDEKQQRLQMDIEQLGYTYHRKRSDLSAKPTDITSGTAAEAILSVWQQRPQQAKYMSREHFGKLYRVIFSDSLNGTQTIIATLLYRIAENRRRRPLAFDPPLVRYASCFLAMQMGKYLLKDLQCSVEELSHRNFQSARKIVEENGQRYVEDAISDVETAIQQLYGNANISMQQLAATFRRGDLIEILKRKEM